MSDGMYSPEIETTLAGVIAPDTCEELLTMWHEADRKQKELENQRGELLGKASRVARRLLNFFPAELPYNMSQGGMSEHGGYARKRNPHSYNTTPYVKSIHKHNMPF